jgi:hypothetical protein
LTAFSQADTIFSKPDGQKKDTVSLSKGPVSVNDSMFISNDSTVIRDSLKKSASDSVLNISKVHVQAENESKTGVSRIFSGKEYLFYYLIFLFLLFGLMRMAFEKYFSDLFRVFFRTTLKQKQIREQLLQTPLPSVLMNLFFVLVAGLYVNFLLLHFHLSLVENFWLQYVYCSAFIAFIYIIKFLGLKITGWLFNVNEAAESYTFIVFIICKMLGIMLLPFLVLISFTSGDIYSNSIVLSWIGIGLLLGYRFILSYNYARKEIKLNPFHFILYIISFEIVPVLLIYKMLLIIL